MANLKDVIAYILKNYPVKHELSNARVTKMVYLADWHQAINLDRQITDIRWYFDNYGPYVDDIRNEAEIHSELFSISSTINMYAQPKLMFTLVDQSYVPVLTENEKNSLEHVINETRKMYWDTFIKLVYSTYPIVSSNRYSYLDLTAKAHQYKLIQ